MAVRKSVPVSPRLKEELFSEEMVRCGEMWKCFEYLCWEVGPSNHYNVTINGNVTLFEYSHILFSQVDYISTYILYTKKKIKDSHCYTSFYHINI